MSRNPTSQMLRGTRKVLIFSLAYHPMLGGAELAVKEITDRLAHRPTAEGIFDIEFDVITLRFNNDHPEKEKIGNCTVYRIKTSKNLYPFKALFLATKLHKNESYDAIWAIMANWAGFAALFFKFKFPKVPYILTLQEGDPISYIKRKVWFVYPLFKQIFKKADQVQAISTFLAKWASEMGYKGQVEVIPNGVDIRRFTNVQHSVLDKEKIVLITTSRLVKKNGVEDIIRSLKFLPENIRLKILGTGPLKSHLTKLVKELGLENRVEFVGFVDHQDMPPHLHGADIFIRPSLSEGFGNSFIEAMASGLPVIATNVGGIPDFLKDQETGLFCNVQDPQSIAEKVMEYVNHPELVSKIVENAKKMVTEKYDWDLVAKEMKTRVFGKV